MATTKPTFNPQELLSTKEAAKYLHRSESTLKRLRKSGQLKRYTCGANGRGNFYLREDLDMLFVANDERIEAQVREVAGETSATAEENAANRGPLS